MTGVAAEVGSTANNYQILARLATGGMAEIFLARGVSGTGVERYCVLKRILRERANDVNFVRMFLDEARLASQLQHPNVAQVYDIGKLGDSYFFTMEYVHGETIRALLHRARSLRREMPTGVVLTIMAGAAGGLHHAHERLGHDGRPLGIVHRDVSPSNLMVSYEGSVKVVDFGVAKAENRAQETRSGTVKGKIAYLSPEACRGGGIDRRSDLFSLGIVFWEMLTTERLYKRASDFENMTAIVNEPPVPPSQRRKGIPPELDRIALKLLEKDPADRYQTADELVDALEETASKLGTMISPSGLGRFLRELFGQRPEPWLELDATQEVPAEGVTVTSEPIPKELVVSVAQSLDGVLAGVPDMMSARPSDDAIPRAPQSSQLTAPASPAAMIDRLPLAAPPPSGVHAPRGFPPLDPNAPISLSSSGSHPYPNTGSHAEYPVVKTTPPRTARSWPLVAIVAAAAIIGSLTVWFVMRSGKDSRVASDAAAVAIVAVEPVDGGVVVVAIEP
ncbi:MAG: protein kinase, partial [Kofleriaceae bacterium]